MKVEFRECNYDDIDFILELKELCLKWYIEIIYGWDIDIQRKFTIQELDEHKKDMRIVMLDNKDIGVTTFYEEDGKYIVGLTMVHPNYQRKGIATNFLNEYIEKAKKDKKVIQLKTYKFNPAKRLYERLGFKQYHEDNTHVYLKIDN